MGAKPSKSIIDDDDNSRINKSRSTNNDRSSHHQYYQRKRNHLKQVLTSKNRKKKVVTSTSNKNTTLPPTNPIVAISTLNETPTTCITEHQLPNKTMIKEHVEEQHHQQQKQQQTEQVESNYILNKRSSPSNNSSNSFYDPLKSKKIRRTNSPSVVGCSSGIASKHLSIISNNTTQTTDYSNKSNISSGGWTTLSNDPFSQIEANTSAFTEITDQSTISRKSLYPVIESNTLNLLPSYYHHVSSSLSVTDVPGISTLDILNELEKYPQQSHHLIIKEAYQRAQQQNDEYDWNQFYHAIHRYISLHSSYKSIGIVYLAKCLIFGLGVSTNIERGLNLLKSHPSCETTYALGRCYLDGFTTANKEIQGVDKVAAFECFKKASEYGAINDSVLSTIGESQCTLARMLFQGEGVNQNTQEALSYLMKSAENNNM